MPAGRTTAHYGPDGMRAALCGGNTVGGMIREREARPDGYRHIDTPAMIRRLTELNANTYFYGVWESATDWDDLREEFLPAAQRAGITVIPYLVPPTETYLAGRASRPYLLDFAAWAREIATLSVEYPVLVGWAIDDFEFAENAELFTAEYMASFKQAQDEINPDLLFYTCAYWESARSEEFLDKYGPFIDGIVYPFLDGAHENTTVATSTGPCLDAILELTEPRGLDLLLLVYTGRFLNAPLAPTEQYVAETLQAGREYAESGRIAGVIAYGCQVDGAATPSIDRRAMYGDGRLGLLAPRVTVPAGATASAEQHVTVAESMRYELSFWYHRAFLPSGVPAGTYELRALIDDEIVWRIDVADQAWNLWMHGDSRQGPVDVTEQVRGKSDVIVRFELVALTDARGAFVDLGIDNVTTIGLGLANGDFADTSAWELDSSGPLLATFDLWVPDRPERIFRAVSTGFAPA